MKKIVIFCVLVLVGTLSFAQNGKLNIDWENIQTIKYPISLVTTSKIDNEVVTLVKDSSYIRQPNDLAIYCTNQSEKYISRAKSAFVAGAVCPVIGGVFAAAGYARNTDSARVSLIAGGAFVLVGVICDIICINDLLQFTKWNHREKAVQFTVKPTGVALSF